MRLRGGLAVASPLNTLHGMTASLIRIAMFASGNRIELPNYNTKSGFVTFVHSCNVYSVNIRGASPTTDYCSQEYRVLSNQNLGSHTRQSRYGYFIETEVKMKRIMHCLFSSHALKDFANGDGIFRSRHRKIRK